jgi:hypothetical protein
MTFVRTQVGWSICFNDFHLRKEWHTRKWLRIVSHYDTVLCSLTSRFLPTWCCRLWHKNAIFRVAQEDIFLEYTEDESSRLLRNTGTSVLFCIPEDQNRHQHCSEVSEHGKKFIFCKSCTKHSQTLSCAWTTTSQNMAHMHSESYKLKCHEIDAAIHIIVSQAFLASCLFYLEEHLTTAHTNKAYTI